MNITKPKGKKTVKRQAKSLLAKSSKKTSKKSQKMEATLLRSSPKLSQIGDLEKGTSIRVPEGFGRAAEESVIPSRGVAEELLRQSELSLTRLRHALKEHAARSAERCKRVQVWLKSDRQRNCCERPRS